MKLTRSNFIKKTTFSLAAFSAFQEIFPQTATTQIKKPSASIKKIVIVGGGLSGLYSAYLLKNAGYEVSIIEAKNRIGGRILTHIDEETKLISELGGEWIQESHFTVKSLCKELDIELKTFSTIRDILTGDKFVESNLVKQSSETKEILKKLISLYEKMSLEKKQGLDKLDIFSFLKYQGVNEEELYQLDMKYSILIGEGLQALSAEKTISLFEFYENGFPFQYKINGGSDKIIETLRNKLKNVSISLSDPVISIEENNNIINIKLKSGKEVSADACILTVPAVQLNNIKFSPDLPKDKKLSILQSKLSRMTKASVIYKGIDYIRDKLYVQSDGIFQSIYSLGNKNKTLNKGSLTLISTGGRSDVCSRLSTEYQNSFIKNNLDNIELLSTLKFEKVQMKSWQNELYIEGATSYYSPATFEIKSILKKNHGRIAFAGEHLGQHNGTMEGALLSAIDAVNSL